MSSHRTTIEITDELMGILGRCMAGKDVSQTTANMSEAEAWLLVAWSALIVANRHVLDDANDRIERLAVLAFEESQRRQVAIEHATT